MKKKELKEFKDKEIKKLFEAVLERKEALGKFLAGKSSEKNNQKGRNLRREIAQILTIIREKEIVQAEKEEVK